MLCNTLSPIRVSESFAAADARVESEASISSDVFAIEVDGGGGGADLSMGMSPAKTEMANTVVNTTAVLSR